MVDEVYAYDVDRPVVEENKVAPVLSALSCCPADDRESQ